MGGQDLMMSVCLCVSRTGRNVVNTPTQALSCPHMRMLYDKATASVDLTSSCVVEWIWRCLSPRPRLPTWLSLRASPFCCNAKLYEAKSTSISHAFLLCWGRDCTLLSFDEQGLGCVILAFLGLELCPAVNLQSSGNVQKHMCYLSPPLSNTSKLDFFILS